MTLLEALKNIEHFVFTEPGLLAKSILRDFKKYRNANLDKLRVKGADLCCWCNVGKIIKPNRRYCSDGCRDSAWAYCNPNTPSSKGWLLIQKQQCACSGCGTLYEDFIIKRVKAKLEGWKKHQEMFPAAYAAGTIPKPPEKVSYHSIFHNTGHFLQVDHIKPIHAGGSGIGLHNVQVLCVPCHREKTRRENISNSRRKNDISI